jgi:hypothetical protein
MRHCVISPVTSVMQGTQQEIVMTKLPCLVGDTEPLPVRVPGTNPPMHRTFWLLMQGDNAQDDARAALYRIRVPQLAAYAPLLAGLLYRAADAEQVAGDACSG